MTKSIEEYTELELREKIFNIKVEREKTADALKRYEEELKRRKQEVPLGVPLKGTANELPYEAVSKNLIKWFSCEASADKFEEYFVNFVKALQDIADGKPIDIKVLLPLLPKGKVAYCPILRKWFWTNEAPQLLEETFGILGDYSWIGGFNIKPAKDWRNSLMECGL